ncbi:DUF4199 domain-containing protein [Adhaeribacter arboris]|uniref:DUF4199 domain-containing protein n=1 Tax=Adhaeribacter arboris TaxID=2072846 RepID=A0A2T2YGC1_9BACT|nr:DUF4199 domain-containing protein [Adhaeribacter arboris]PSR54561.1 DUF4199 domain-containing protein [Adhaeribacter arboris]
MENYSTTSVSPSKNAIALRYGVIFGIISIVYSLILNITDLAFTNQALSWFSFLILIAAIVLAMREFKRQNNNYMSYGQGLGIGTLVTAVSSALGGIFTYIYVKFIDTGFIDKMREMQVSELEKKGMNDDQIDQAVAMSDKMMTPEMIVVFAILAGLFFGFLLSLIISALIKRTRPEFE